MSKSWANFHFWVNYPFKYLHQMEKPRSHGILKTCAQRFEDFYSSDKTTRHKLDGNTFTKLM